MIDLSKKQVLFVMHLPPPIHGASIVGKYIQESNLIREHFYCDFINMSASTSVDEVGKVSLKKIFFLFKNLFSVLYTVIRKRPNLCYITPTSDGWGFYRDFILVQSLKLFRVEVLLHFHNKSSEGWISKSINQTLLRIFFKNVNVILLGRELYPQKAPFVNLDQVYYCPNGIPGSKCIALPKRSHTGFVKFLFLSNMMKEKGVYILLEACKILKKQNIDFICDFVGGWKDVTEAEFSKNVLDLDLSDVVKYYGPVYGENKMSFFQNADVFIFPTYYHGETFGLVLLEAMSWGLPCITTNEGAIPSVIENNETGFCIGDVNSQKIADSMIWMINNPNKRMEMGLKGRHRFNSKFTLDRFEQRISEILMDVLTKSNV